MVSNCFIAFILLYYTYYDLKLRRISNRFFIINIFIGVLFNFLNLFYNINFSMGDLAIKVFLIFLSLLISVYLFSIKIIGGSDGKLIIILFFSKILFNSLLSFIIVFYFFFTFFYIGLILMTFLVNGCIKYRFSFEIYFNTTFPLSTLKQIFIKSYYIFQDLSKLSEIKEDKYQLYNGGLFFNTKTLKLQILAQYRPPITLIIFLSYIVSFLMIG
ncbi:MAG: prepilin peptidase [Candidatus Lokiarchaeota archaeon]|nr:prepilin peptidase [Candidatus Lokiarchaeota archaeon]